MTTPSRPLTVRLAEAFINLVWSAVWITCAALIVFVGALFLQRAWAIEPEFSCPVADPVDGESEQVERPAVFKKVAYGLDTGSKA